ncbi:MAG TPA: response regulator transcription factor [Actinomycetota bacterium]
MKDRRIRVLVVDDHLLVAQGIAGALGTEEDLDVVGVANSAAQARLMAHALRPDVILMDFRLPDGDGAETTRQIRMEHPAIKTVIMTSYTSDPVLLAAVESGCSGFIPKEHCLDEGIDAIRVAAAGGAYITPSMLSRVLPRLHRGGRSPTTSMTPREHSILELLVEGLSTRVIADRLGLRIKTVRNHVQNIMTKLDAHSRLEAVAAAMRQGLITSPGSSRGA